MENNGTMWCMLLHLGGNMWNEEGNTRQREHNPDAVASPTLRFSKPLWDRYLMKMKDCGVNTIVLDLGEGLRYESHPELAVEGSWTRETMTAELEKQVCGDLIREVCDIFRPRFFHLGMDEETAGHQTAYDYCVIRQHDLWWHDFYYLVDCVERENARAWIWSDYMWNHRDVFLSKMPKSVLQSNWYYSPVFEDKELSDGGRNMLECFDVLDKNGFEQVPTGSTWSSPDNTERLTAYCKSRFSGDRLLGFMQTPWYLTLDANEAILNEAADRLCAARKLYEGI